MHDEVFQLPEMRHTRNLRKPNWRERLHCRFFGVYPDSYAQARLAAYHKDEMEMRLDAQRLWTERMKRHYMEDES